jgi:hypothetical protein
MRRWFVGLAIALSVTSASEANAQSVSDCAARLAKAREDMLAFYPPVAKAAGVEGSATIICGLVLQGAPNNCTVAAETPPDQGFGKAALMIASATQDTTAVHSSEKQTGHPTTKSLLFRLSPPVILPDLLALRTVGHPSWRDKPSGDDIMIALTKAGARRDRSGNTNLLCSVADNGRMSACGATEETPAGSGFGRAAMYLASRFAMSPKTDIGCPVGGLTVDIPIRFVFEG